MPKIASPFFRESSQELFAQAAHRFWGHQGPGFCSAHAHDASQLVVRLLFVVIGTGTASTTATVVLGDDGSLGKVVHCMVLSIHGFNQLFICFLSKLLSYYGL